MSRKQRIVVVGAGPVGSLAALYAAQRGHDVELYELRNGKPISSSSPHYVSISSAVLPAERNLLINPRHPDFAKIKIQPYETPRLFQP